MSKTVLSSITWIVLATAVVQADDGDLIIDGKPVATLVKQMKSENRGLQLRAAQALAKAETNDMPGIVPLLVTLLDSDRENDRFVAAQTLGNYGPLARPAALKLLPVLKGTQYERNRAAAAKALGQILVDAKPSEDIEQVTVALMGLFNDKYCDVQREAIIACGMIGPAAKACLPALPAKMDEATVDHADQIQRATAWTCGRMGPLAAMYADKLINMMHSRTYPQVVEALGQVGVANDSVVKNITARMEKVMYTKDYMLYEAEAADYIPKCLATLEKFGPKAKGAVPLINRCLSEGEWYNPWSIRWAIGGFRVLGAVGTEAKETAPTIEKALQITRFDDRIPREVVEQFKKEARAALTSVKGEDGEGMGGAAK